MLLYIYMQHETHVLNLNASICSLQMLTKTHSKTKKQDYFHSRRKKNKKHHHHPSYQERNKELSFVSQEVVNVTTLISGVPTLWWRKWWLPGGSGTSAGRDLLASLPLQAAGDGRRKSNLLELPDKYQRKCVARDSTIKDNHFSFSSLFIYLYDYCPCWLTFTWWGCYSLCQRHKPIERAHSFIFCSCVYFCLYGPFNCISFHKFSW